MSHEPKEYRIILGVLAAFAGASLCTGADLQAGKRAYDQGDYATALREFLPLAEKGDAEAQRYLGDMSRDGKGTSVNEPMAVRWYRSAAAQGDLKARFDVVDLCTSGRLHVQAPGARIVEMDDDPLTRPCSGVDPEKEDAQIRSGIRAIAQRGDAEAQFMLAMILRSDTNSKFKFTNTSEARDAYKSESRENDKWLRDSAKQGHTKARVILILDCSLIFLSKAKKGMPVGKAEGEPDVKECRDMRASLSDKSDALSPHDQWVVGVSYLYIPDRDPTRAVSFLEAAAKRGFTGAQDFLGGLFYEGTDVPKDYARAAQWYRNFGESTKVAIENFHQVREALERLGYLYSGVEGIPTDDKEAARWFLRAAEMGSIYAQRSMAFRYRDGLGVTKDSKEMARWVRRAAEQGDVSSQFLLGWALYFGIGVPQDYIHAHMWLNLAAANGDSESRQFRDDVVAKLMSPEQIAQAQALATAWSPNPDPGDITQVR